MQKLLNNIFLTIWNVSYLRFSWLIAVGINIESVIESFGHLTWFDIYNKQSAYGWQYIKKPYLSCIGEAGVSTIQYAEEIRYRE